MKRIGLILLVIVLLSLARTKLMHFLQPGSSASTTSSVEAGSVQSGSGVGPEHFSPSEDLERLDLAQLAQAHSTIDVAMYAFTDRRIAEALAHTDSSVQIRLYRDGEQFDNEQRHATYNEPSTTQMLAGHACIHIRVKHGASRDYMHCKEVLIDGRLLREGSANWSKSALHFQDNSWFLIADRQDILRFAQKFNEMWNRPSNLVVQ